MRLYGVFLALFMLLSFIGNAQVPKKYTSAEIHHEIQKLNFLGTVLYLAAHPDDENTRLISYLSNALKARTVYLSLTRGDGGQNLIGTELRELLGVLRTQELLGARRLDGGEQRFTRANDFGYSKHPDETLSIWDKNKVLGDLIWNIRQLRPDIIINRFNHRTPGTTHGHHTASAQLSYEAFDLINDPNAFSEQLDRVALWQPKRLYFNTSWWFYGSHENFEKADKSNMATIDVGVYYPALGISNNEIASLASSQHKCQGFGRLMMRGSQPEYIELLKGEKPTESNAIFDGINITWSRIKSGEAIGAILTDVEKHFNFENPAKHIPQLIEAYNLLQQVEDTHWKNIKTKHLKDIILACGGIYLEANSKISSAIPGEKLTLTIEALNRSDSDISLKSVTVTETNTVKKEIIPLLSNEKKNIELDLLIPKNTPYTNPYWLNETSSLGMYNVTDANFIGKPETPAAFTVSFLLNIEGIDISFTKPLIHRFSKPDVGEVYEPFAILPQVTARFNEDVFLFNTSEPINIDLSIRSEKDTINGTAELELPKGWSSNPSRIPFSITQKGATKAVTFKVTPPENESIGNIYSLLKVNGAIYNKKLVEIDYPHIPKQSILLTSKAKVVRMDIKKEGNRIGYIVGAGDKVAESLSQIGYTVDLLEMDDIQPEKLQNYHGIVLGIRAYNVVDELKYKQHILLDYVKNGGNMIVQYNTAGRWRSQLKNIAPYPLTISRDRVADENALVEILEKDHPLINHPNKIELKDFEGWVQERGLYFPNEWDTKFTPILSMADEGESSKKGSLLVASYGNGYYIYTGLSFFRELPAGVPGAYKLFANMLSLK